MHLHDGYAIEIVWNIPKPPADFDLCSDEPAPCPVITNGPYIMLAAVRLPPSEQTPLRDQDVINL